MNEDIDKLISELKVPDLPEKYSVLMHPDVWRMLHTMTIQFLNITFGRGSFSFEILQVMIFNDYGSILSFSWDKTLGFGGDFLWIGLITSLVRKAKEDKENIYEEIE